MGIRLDAAGDTLSWTTSPLGYNANYTVSFWFKLKAKTASNAYLSIFDLFNAAGTDYAVFGVHGASATVTNLGFFSGDTPWVEGWGSTSLALNTWYHVAIIRASATDHKVYLNGVLEATITGNVGAYGTQANMAFGDNGPDCVISDAKIWATNLTLADLQQEMYVIRPVRYLDLYGFWPMLPGAVERLRDYSGNGRNWNDDGGALTDEDDPPIGWGAPPYVVTVPTVVASVSVQTATATLASSGQALKPQKSIPVSTSTLTSAGQVLKVRISVPVSTATLAGQGQKAQASLPAPGISISISTAQLAGSGQGVKRQRPILVSTVTLTSSGQAIKLSCRINLSTASLSSSGQSIKVSRRILLATATLASSAVKASSQVTKAVRANTATLSSSGQSLKISRRISVSTGSLTFSPQGLKLPRRIVLSTATLASSGVHSTPSNAQAVNIHLNTAVLAGSGLSSHVRAIRNANVVTVNSLMRGRQTVAVLTNRSGAPVVEGDVVIVSRSDASSFTTTSTPGYSLGIIGVAVETIPANELGRICTHGYISKVNLSSSASMGYTFSTHSVAKIAAPHNVLQGGDFGQVLGTGTTPGALLWGHPIGDESTINPMTAAGDLIVGGDNGSTVRKAIGTEGQVLSVSGGQPEWATSYTSAAEGRLTLTSGNPVIKTDQLTADTVYFTPFNGNHIGLYDGGWRLFTFSQLSIKLTNVLSGTLVNGNATVTVDATQLVAGMEVTGTGIQSTTTIQSVTNGTTIVLSKTASGSGAQSLTFKAPMSALYDIFIFNNAGTPKLEFCAWTNAWTRATTLSWQDGILAKTGDIARRYLGSVMVNVDVAGQTQMKVTANADIRLWNMYNRILLTVYLSCPETHSYASSIWRQWGGVGTNRYILLCGVGYLSTFEAHTRFYFTLTPGSTKYGSAGLCANATDSLSSMGASIGANMDAPILCLEDTFINAAHLINGINTINCVEYGNASPVTFTEARGRGLFSC
jgi:hypothetical protein